MKGGTMQYALGKDATTAMTSVVYIASEGYYFPTDYSVTAVNGIRRSRLM